MVLILNVKASLSENSWCFIISRQHCSGFFAILMILLAFLLYEQEGRAVFSHATFCRNSDTSEDRSCKLTFMNINRRSRAPDMYNSSLTPPREGYLKLRCPASLQAFSRVFSLSSFLAIMSFSYEYTLTSPILWNKIHLPLIFHR